MNCANKYKDDDNYLDTIWCTGNDYWRYGVAFTLAYTNSVILTEGELHLHTQ